MAANVVTGASVGELANQLSSIAGKWELFLSQLNVSKARRELIMAQHKGSTEYAKHCLLEGLEGWVRSDKSPTYEKIAAALQSELMDDTELADKIEQMYLRQAKDCSDESDQEILDCPPDIMVTSDDLIGIFKEGRTDEKTDGVLTLLKAADNPISTVTNEDHQTLLHLACRNHYTQWLPIAKTLVEVYSCDPLAQDRYGNTPLHDACQHKNQELLEYLLSLESCDPNIRNLRNETALHIARYCPDIVRTLLASDRVDNTVVDKVLQMIKTSDDPTSFQDVKYMLEDYTHCVKEHDSSTNPFRRKTCCVLLDTLERSLLRNKTKCKVKDIVTFCQINCVPLPYDSKEICNLLADISAREHLEKKYKVSQCNPPENTVVTKRPPAYKLQGDEDDVDETSPVLSLLTPDARCTHTHTESQNPPPYEERHTAEGQRVTEAGSSNNIDQSSSRSFFQWSVGGAASFHRVIESVETSLNIHSHSEPLESIPEKVRPSSAPRQTAADKNHRRLLSQPTTTTHQWTRHHVIGRTCYSCCTENEWDCRSSEDFSCIKCISCKDCWRKHPRRCCLGSLIATVILLLLGILIIFAIAFTIPESMSISGVISTRPNDTALVRNEGFDPSKLATVVIEKVPTSDPHVVSFYLERCNELTALPLTIETAAGSHIEIVKQQTALSSYYLLVGSELTFVVTLNEAVHQRLSEIIIFDSAADHFSFIHSNMTKSRGLIFPLSNGSTTFPFTASNSSYYFIDLFSPMSAVPTSIQYQVNGTIFYYDPTNFQKACAIVPGVNFSCSISLRPRTTDKYCILTQANPLNDNDGTFVNSTFVNNTYISESPPLSGSQLSGLVIGVLFFIVSISIVFWSICSIIIQLNKYRQQL